MDAIHELVGKRCEKFLGDVLDLEAQGILELPKNDVADRGHGERLRLAVVGRGVVEDDLGQLARLAPGLVLFPLFD